MALTSELARAYWRDGYCVLPGLFDPGALERFEARFLEIASGERPPPANMIVMEDVMVVRGAALPASRLHGINKLLSFEGDPVLFRHSLDARLLAAVRSLLGHDLMTISTNVFNKPPGVDGRHPLHQDLRYFTLRPADGIVAAWTAISRCTRQNGCLAVVPGSHREGQYRHGLPDWEYVNAGFFCAEGVDLERRVHIPLEPGDTLLFHPLLVHGSGRNRGNGFRRAISTHYASTSCRRNRRKRSREPVVHRIPS